MRDDSTQGRDELDILLDAALATYVDSEPSPSLTPRILAAARDVDRRPSVGWLSWAVPALAAALLMTIFLTHRPAARRQTPQPTADLSAPRVPASAERIPDTPGNRIAATEATPHLGSNPPRAARSVRITAPIQPLLPRQEVFPTPAPLSPEEQALAAEVNRNAEGISRQVAQSADHGPEQPIEPLHIAAIHIPPLNPPDNGDN
jgi:hypothetical protein